MWFSHYAAGKIFIFRDPIPILSFEELWLKIKSLNQEPYFIFQTRCDSVVNKDMACARILSLFSDIVSYSAITGSSCNCYSFFFVFTQSNFKIILKINF